MKKSAYSGKQSAAKQEAQQRFLALIANGHLIKDALKQVNRTDRAYREWRREDAQFAAKVDTIRAGNGALKGSDFVEARKVYFNHDTPPHHARMVDAIEKTGPDEITLILCAPEAGKTSVLVDYVNWKLAEDPNFRVALVSEAQGLARKIGGQVKLRMTDDVQFGAFIERYGPFKAPDRSLPKPWQTDFFTVVQSNHDEKEHSFEALGAGSQIYGGRFDLVVFDDVQSFKRGALSPSTDTLLQWMRQMVISRLTKGCGKLVIIGSRIDRGDFYERLLEEDLVHNLVQIPALTKPLSPEEHFTKRGKTIELAPGAEEKTESFWPGYWSLLDLAKKRAAVGETAWWRSYMQQPKEAVEMTFSESVIETALDWKRRYAQPIGRETVVAVDPALASWAAVSVCGLDLEQLHVIDAEAMKALGRTEELIAVIGRFAAQYRPSTVIIERDWNHGLLEDDRLRGLAEKFGFDIVPHQTSQTRQDPMIGLRSLASSWAAGEVTIPYADEESRERMAELIIEARKWRSDIPARHLRQDVLMSVWFAWRFWLAWKETVEIEMPRFWRPSWA